MSFDNGFPDNNDFSDIDQWQEHYEVNQGDFEPDPSVLPEGTYDFEIVSAKLEKTNKTQETLFKLGLRVTSGQSAGVTFVRPNFFRSQDNLDRLGGDLVTLGLDAQAWGKRGKSWSAELLAACPSLVGKRFRGQRKNGKPGADGKVFYNLYIQSLLAANGPPPASAPASPFTAAPQDAQGAPIF